MAWRQRWLSWRYPMIARSYQNTRSKEPIDPLVPPTILEHTRYIQPIPPKRSMCLQAWIPHRKARSSNFSVRTGTYLRGVQPTCQVFPRNSPSTLSNYSPTRNQSARNKTHIRTKASRSRSRSRPATQSRICRGSAPGRVRRYALRLIRVS